LRPKISWTQHGETGPPVLLVMGFTMRGRVWRPQIQTLPKHHRVITFDHRGLGDSEGSDDWFTMADMAGDALGVLDEAGWPSAHVVGVSMGGMIAQEIALRAPERIRSLALIATHGGGRTAWIPGFAGLRGLLSAASADPQKRARGLQRMLYPEEWVRTQDPNSFLSSLEDRLSYRAPGRTTLRQLRAVARHRALNRLGAISAKTLVILPEKDVLIDPRNSERLAEVLPNCELVRFPQAGHGIIHQEAPALNAQLLAHFEECESTFTG